MTKYLDEEFFNIIERIIDNKEFQKTKDITHHGITRYDHCLRVAYFSYKVSKFLHLNYQEITEAAILHDFFLNEMESENGLDRLRKHPQIAAENAKKYFNINKRQEDMIKTHMFPITLAPPTHIGSYIIDIVDDVAAIYEKTATTKNELSAAMTFLLLIVVNFIKYR